MDGINVSPFTVSLRPELRAREGNAGGEGDRGAPPFAEVLRSSVMKVNQIQAEADEMTNKLALGEVEDISEVSIAVEKAELALRLMVQIRDKLVDAYQQISRMGV